MKLPAESPWDRPRFLPCAVRTEVAHGTVSQCKSTIARLGESLRVTQTRKEGGEGGGCGVPGGQQKNWRSKGSQSLTAAGHRAVVWSLQGDHEMYSNVLHLPHWNNVAPCWECDCMRPWTKGEPCPAGKSFKLIRPSEQSFEYIKNPGA